MTGKSNGTGPGDGKKSGNGKANGKADVRAAIFSADPAPGGDAGGGGDGGGGAPSYLSFRFDMRGDGLFLKPADGGGRGMWICGPFTIEAETRDPENRCWALLLSWHDRDGTKHEEVFPRALFAGECTELRRLLADGGLRLNASSAARQAFAEYLNLCGGAARARTVARVGWHEVAGRSVFVLPGVVFGSADERVLLHTGERDASLFQAAGTLEGWRTQVSKLCEGNSRLLFSASCAFAAPLLGLLGEDGGGFHLLGQSRVGKTSALRVAASVCGGTPADGAKGFVRQWRATGNGLESVAAAHCDCLLPLDEMSQVDGREAGEIAYMLANGQGKARAARMGQSRPTVRFRVLFLSTGEISLGDKNAEAGKATMAGQEVRLANIPADPGFGHGLFENLHDIDNGTAFSDELRDATNRQYGTALPAFLKHVAAELARDRARFADELRAEKGRLVAGWLDSVKGAGGQVHSVASRFALVGLAGELASRIHVTAWPEGAAAEAAKSCFLDWLKGRGTAGAREDAQAVEQLRGFISRHGSARFQVWQDAPSHEAAQAEPSNEAPPPERFRVQQRAGFKRWMPHEGGRMGWRYYMTAEGMKEALAGLALREALKTLAELGHVVPSKAASDVRRNAIMGAHAVPGEGKLRLYELSDDLQAGEGGD
jgi:putative DNA primase/helicase